MNKLFIRISGMSGFVLLFAGFVKYLIDGFLSTPASIILSAGLASALVYAAYNLSRLKSFINKRATQHVGNALAVSILLVGIVVMLNYIFNKHNYRIDLTENKQFSLADQTIKVLQNLEEDINVTAFFQSAQQTFVDDMITEYRYYSDKLQYRFFDPNKNPEVAANYGVQAYGVVFLEAEGRSEKIETFSEQALTNALIKVTRDEKKTVYYMSGHGEHDIESLETKGFSTLKDRIIELNYDVKVLNLAREKSVPGNSSVLIINGPKTTMFGTELDSIDAYVNRGGKVLFLLDPPPDPGMVEFFDNWGLIVGNDLVIDYSGVGQLFGYSASVPLVSEYNSSHPIAENFNMNTFYELVRSVTPKSEDLPPGVTVDWLARTTPQSWGESNFQWNEENPDEAISVSFDEAVDIEGPVTIAAIASKSMSRSFAPGNSSDQGTLVVFGDSDFATNGYSQTSNSILFLNTINWLAEEDDLVAIPPKSVDDRRITMTAQQTKFLFWLTVVFMPVMVLGTGIGIFIRRRKN